MVDTALDRSAAGAASDSGGSVKRWRRWIFAVLVVATMALLIFGMARILGQDGLTPVEIAMLAVFALNLPWLTIGLWNAIIGLAIWHLSRDPVGFIFPAVRHGRGDVPLKGRTAIVMPIHNEEPQRVFRHLRALVESLDATGQADAFDIFVLSDTQDRDVSKEEAVRFGIWKASDHRPERLHYRRRPRNEKHKVGNIRDFLDRWGDSYDYMLVLDADSLMSGEAVLRMTRVMEATPGLGILQTLVTGLPNASPFARIFQFGMRHGMRTYTMGSAWWQQDQGPYWGHNAILRLAPFRDHCKLPQLPGKPPLGGDVLSHDQVEAVLMRRAGYEVRVLPDEFGSYEENPPTLPDFVKRDLRWCQGNMQYTKLLGMNGLLPLGRVQLLLAILMYMTAPLWFTFLFLGFGQAIVGGGSPMWPDLMSGLPAPGDNAAVTFFIILMAITFAPKLAGFADVLLSRGALRAYGGLPRFAGGMLVETVFSVLLSPIMALAQSIFIIGLFLGRKIAWDAQARTSRSISLREALRGLWPQTLLGVVAAATLIAFVPSVLPWAVPILAGLLLAIPFAVISSWERPGQWLVRAGLCAIPEEREIPDVLSAAGHGQLARPAPGRHGDKPPALPPSLSGGSATPVGAGVRARSD